jgi:hypothetical protein
MLVVGLLFLIWELARPLPPPDRPTADRPDADRPDADGPHAP